MNILKKAGTVLQGIPKSANPSALGPPDRFYNTDEGLRFHLQANGITDTSGIINSVTVMVVDGDNFDMSLEHDDAGQLGVIASASASMSAGTGVVDEEVIFSSISDAAVLRAADNIRIIIVGAASASIDEVTAGGKFALNGHYELLTAEFFEMPGSKYVGIADYAAAKDAGSRVSRIDSIQIKAPSDRRDIAPPGHVSAASGAVYLDELLDGFAGELQRMKDIRGSVAWDASADKWYVDSHHQMDGRGRFVLSPTDMALEAHGGIYSGLAVLGDDLASRIVDVSSQFSLDGADADADGIFDAPLSWIDAWNNAAVRSHLGELLGMTPGHPEILAAPEPSGAAYAAGTVQAWFISKVASGTGLDSSGDATSNAPDIVVDGEGSLDGTSAPMLIPGFVKELGDSSIGAGSADGSGAIRPLAESSGDNAFAQEIPTGSDKLDYIRLARNEDSVKMLLGGGFGSDAIFTKGGMVGLDIAAALAELKLSASAADSHVSAVTFDAGTNLLQFTGSGSAMDADVDLSALVGAVDLSTESIDGLLDVDITTDAVTEGEMLVWRTDKFVPELAPADSHVSAVTFNASSNELEFTGAGSAMSTNVSLAALAGGADGNDIDFISSVVLSGTELQFVGTGNAVTVNVDLAGLLHEDHNQEELAISGAKTALHDLQFASNIHPAMAGNVDDADETFKDKLAVYRNGIRLSKNDYQLSGTGQDYLKLESALNDGDYIIVEVKAPVA